MKKKKYAIHPGYIELKDGRYQKIGYTDLINAYRLNNKDCVLWDDCDKNTYAYRNWNDYIHLYVRVDGNYSLPKKGD